MAARAQKNAHKAHFSREAEYDAWRSGRARGTPDRPRRTRELPRILMNNRKDPEKIVRRSTSQNGI